MTAHSYSSFLDFYYQFMVLQMDMLENYAANRNSDFKPLSGERMCVLRPFWRARCAWESPVKVGLQLVTEKLSQEKWKLNRIRLFDREFNLLDELVAHSGSIAFDQAAGFLEKAFPKEHFPSLENCYHDLAQGSSSYDLAFLGDHFSFGEEEFRDRTKVSKCRIFPATKVVKNDVREAEAGQARGLFSRLFSGSPKPVPRNYNPEYHYPFRLDTEVIFFPFGMLKYHRMKLLGRKGCKVLIAKSPSPQELEEVWLTNPSLNLPEFDVDAFSSARFEDGQLREQNHSIGRTKFEPIAPTEGGETAMKMIVDDHDFKGEALVEFDASGWLHTCKTYREGELWKKLKHHYDGNRLQKMEIEFPGRNKQVGIAYVYENGLLVRKDKSESASSKVESIHFAKHDAEGNWLYAWKGDEKNEKGEKVKREIEYC